MIEKDKLDVLEIIRKYPGLILVFKQYGALTWEEFEAKYDGVDRLYIGCTELKEPEFNKVKKWYYER